MDVDALRGSPVGELVPISGTDGRTGRHYEHVAFVPHPLPREVELSSATWTIVARAEASLARLDQAARQIPDPTLLRATALRREAQSTSALEGTYAPLEEVLEPDAEEAAGASPEVREVLNYVVAAERGFAWVAERPITGGLVRDLQLTLVRGTPGELPDTGRLRDRQVFIGPPGATVEKARFVPPPPGDLLRVGFEAWLGWVNAPPAAMPPVVQAALGHYQFETLHPFSDGNGRIGRLLIALQLVRCGVLGEAILVVSPWFEARRDEYQDGMLDVSRTGGWDAWVRFFATGVEAAATTTRERVAALLGWREAAVDRIRGAGVSGVAERVAAGLIGAPVVRAADVAGAHRVTPQAARNALRRLADLGLVVERRRGGRLLFVAEEVVAIIRR